MSRAGGCEASGTTAGGEKPLTFSEAWSVGWTQFAVGRHLRFGCSEHYHLSRSTEWWMAASINASGHSFGSATSIARWMVGNLVTFAFI
jgi:hypothetical protein